MGSEEATIQTLHAIDEPPSGIANQPSSMSVMVTLKTMTERQRQAVIDDEHHRQPHQVCIPSSLCSERAAEGMARVWLETTVAVPPLRGSQIQVPLVFGHQQQ